MADVISRVTQLYAIDLVSLNKGEIPLYYGLTLSERNNITKQKAGPFYSSGADYVECFDQALKWHKENKDK